MKQLELSLTERLAFSQLLGAQKSSGGGAAKVRPFFRVLSKIRLNAEEKKTLVYAEYPVPAPNGGMLTQSTWDRNAASEFPSKKFLVETPDAEACLELLKSLGLDCATGDIEWIDAVQPQLEAKDIAVVPAEVAA